LEQFKDLINNYRTFTMPKPTHLTLFTALASWLFLVQTAFADDVVTLFPKEDTAQFAQEKSIGVARVSVGDSIRCSYFKDAPNEKKKEMIRDYFWKFFPPRSAEVSKFKSVLPCTSAAMSYAKQKFKCRGRNMDFIVPAEDSASMLALASAPTLVLFVELPLLYKEPKEFKRNEVANSPDKDSDLDPGEECVHLICKFVFWDRRSSSVVCYGAVTAEGCGYGINRYGPDGIWDKSISDLAQQIYEETPFSSKQLEIKDKSRQFMQWHPFPPTPPVFRPHF
jgi:hypothetical protein